MEEGLAGVDRGCGSHAACVLDAKGAALERFEVGHDREGLAASTARLRRHGAPPVAIGRPTGLLVDHLVEAGLVVVPIRPDAAKACRPPPRRVRQGRAGRRRSPSSSDQWRTNGGPWLALASPSRGAAMSAHASRPTTSSPSRPASPVERLSAFNPTRAATPPERQPHQSGRSRGVGRRWACNERLRAALTCFADTPPPCQPLGRRRPRPRRRSGPRPRRRSGPRPRARPRPRLRPPPRHPHPRQSLGPPPLARLDRSPALRSQPTPASPRPTRPRTRHQLTQGSLTRGWAMPPQRRSSRFAGGSKLDLGHSGGVGGRVGLGDEAGAGGGVGASPPRDASCPDRPIRPRGRPGLRRSSPTAPGGRPGRCRSARRWRRVRARWRGCRGPGARASGAS